MTFDNVRKELRKEARRRVDRASELMTAELKRGAPVDTGELRRRTGVAVVSETNTVIKAEAVIDVEYAEVVVHGSRPHIIRARNKQALAFRIGGQTIIVKSVNHPGTQPNLFFERVVSRWASFLR